MANSINNNNNTNPLLDQLGIQQKTAAANANQNPGSLGQADFLKLMVAQLQNQSPLKPQDNGEFLGQMAQFSTVSGLQDMQKTLNSLSSSLLSNQALQASSLVGRYVSVAGDTATLTDGKGNRPFAGVDLTQSVPNLKFEVMSPTGQIVKTVNMGPQAKGPVSFSWDGVADDGTQMPPGQYTVRATSNESGTQVAHDTTVTAPVESVNLGSSGQQMKLNVTGVGAISMSDIKEIMS